MRNTVFDFVSIDNNALSSFGIQSLSISSFKLPEMKEGSATYYSTEGYQVKPYQYEKIEFKGVISAPSFEVFTGYLFSFYLMLMGSGLRSIQNEAGETFADSFFSEGMKVSNLQVDEEGHVVASIVFEAYIKERDEITAISDLSVVAEGFNTRLSWSESDSASTYNIYRKEASDPSYVLIDTISETTYLDQQVTAGTFQYVVTALNVSGIESDQSNQVEIALSFFTSIWDTTRSGVSDSNSIQLPIPNTEGISIDWGDGVIEIEGGISHDYSGTSGPGVYTIRIAGTVHDWAFVGAGDALKISTVSEFGVFQPTGSGVFQGCENLDVTATDVPDLSQTSTLQAFFSGCHSLVFNASISQWDVSGITSINSFLREAHFFNQSLNDWQTSAFTDISFAFNNATSYDQPMDGWDVGNVTTMQSTFHGASIFNQDLTSWTPSSCLSLQNTFRAASQFNGNISSWTFNVLSNLNGCFYSANAFNRDLSGWDVVNVTNFNNCFLFATAFNSPIFTVNTSGTSNVEMERMFESANAFNQSINNWDVSNVIDMFAMFKNTNSFNQPLDQWNVNNVSFFREMFRGSVFNSAIFTPDTSGNSAVDLFQMFRDNTAFNQNLNGWNTINVTRTQNAFSGATSYNQPMNNWNLGRVANMSDMFNGASSFNQDISTWDISSMTNAEFILLGSGMSTANYDLLLDVNNGWPSRSPQDNVVFGAGTIQYTAGGDAEAGRTDLVNNHTWTITDGGAI